MPRQKDNALAKLLRALGTLLFTKSICRKLGFVCLGWGKDSGTDDISFWCQQSGQDPGLNLILPFPYTFFHYGGHPGGALRVLLQFPWTSASDKEVYALRPTENWQVTLLHWASLSKTDTQSVQGFYMR